MAAEETVRRQFCGQCGQENPPGNRFCGACGAVIVPIAPAVVVSSAPASPAAPTIDPPRSSDPPVIAAQPMPVPVEQATSSPPVAPAAASAVASQPVITPAASPPAPAIRPGPALAGVALERERDRLLTLVNVQRMRGQTGDARQTLEEIVALSQGLPPRDVAPTQEMIGDLFAADEKWDQALEAYRKARDIDPSRPSAERKFAELTLRIADRKAEKRLAEAMMRGDDINALLAGNALATGRGRRNAGVAMLLSAVIPGFGQFYNGELVKGAIVLGIFALTMLYAILSGDLDTFVSKVTSLVTVSVPNAGGHHGNISSQVAKYSSHSLSFLSICVAVVLVGAWLYAIVDAPFMASKTPKNETGPAIDKTGWEV